MCILEYINILKNALAIKHCKELISIEDDTDAVMALHNDHNDQQERTKICPMTLTEMYNDLRNVTCSGVFPE